jgi:chromosome segregation ATPase
MTIRKTTLTIALLVALLVGGAAVLAGVTPMWRGRTDDLRAQTGVLTERSDTLHNDVLRLTRQKEDLLGRLDAVSRQAFESREQLRHSVTGLEAKLDEGRQTVETYRRTLDDERTVADQAITTANEQLLALDANLRQSVAREGARSQQAAALQGEILRLQGALKTLDDQRIAERDRLLADLGRSQRDTAALQNHAAQVVAAAREAGRVAANRLATLQHELRQWQKRAAEVESRLADSRRQWRRDESRQRDDRKSSDRKAGDLQKKANRLTGELAKAQSDLAEANRRIAALESRPSGQRKVRLGRPVSDSSDN